MTALVSCIIPVWNCERYLAQAIDSVLRQTFRSFEVIVVDDGSTDATPDVIDRYRGGIRALRQDNVGAGEARNTGLRLARGSFIAFLDADDLWEPTKLEFQMQHIQVDSARNINTVFVQNFWIDELAAEREQFESSALARAQAGYCLSAALIRRRLFDCVGLFDDKRFGVRSDRAWFVELRRLGFNIDVIPRMLVRRRIHFDNLTRQRAADSLDGLFEIARWGIAARNHGAELATDGDSGLRVARNRKSTTPEG